MRKVLLVASSCLAAMLFAGVPSAAAQSLGGCQLQGTANFSPGLNSGSQSFNYNFGGSLTGCQSSNSGDPTSGTVSAGQTVTEQVVNSITGATDTVTYQEPVPTGSATNRVLLPDLIRIKTSCFPEDLASETAWRTSEGLLTALPPTSTRVLVTGAAGNVGHAVVRHLIEDARYEVHASDQREFPPWIRECCETHTGDLRDTEH